MIGTIKGSIRSKFGWRTSATAPSTSRNPKKKRKAIPNPNRRFIALSEALAGDKAIPEDRDEESISNVVDSDSEEEEEAVEAPANIVVSRPLQIMTRSGRVVKKKQRYE